MKFLLIMLFVVSCASHHNEPVTDHDLTCVMTVKRYGPNKKEVCVKRPSQINRIGPNKW